MKERTLRRAGMWALLVLGVAAMGPAQAVNFGDMMSPGRWFGGSQDRDGGYGEPYYGPGYHGQPYGQQPYGQQPYGQPYGFPSYGQPYGQQPYSQPGMPMEGASPYGYGRPMGMPPDYRDTGPGYGLPGGFGDPGLGVPGGEYRDPWAGEDRAQQRIHELEKRIEELERRQQEGRGQQPQQPTYPPLR